MDAADVILVTVGVGYFALGWIAGVAYGAARPSGGGIQPRGRPKLPPPTGGGTGAPNIAKRPAGRYRA